MSPSSSSFGKEHSELVFCASYSHGLGCGAAQAVKHLGKVGAPVELRDFADGVRVLQSLSHSNEQVTRCRGRHDAFAVMHHAWPTACSRGVPHIGRWW